MLIRYIISGLLFFVIFPVTAQNLQSVIFTQMDELGNDTKNTLTSEFFYDAKNRLTEFIIIDDTYVLRYDDKNRLESLLSYNSQQALADNKPYRKALINWENKTIYYSVGDEILMNNSPIVLNEKGQVIGFSDFTFTYDNLNRINQYQFKDKNKEIHSTFNYDEKVGIFNNVIHCDVFCFLIPYYMLSDLFLSQKNNLIKVQDPTDTSNTRIYFQEIIFSNDNIPQSAIFKNPKRSLYRSELIYK